MQYNTIQGEQMILVARFMKFLYYITIVAAFCANMIVVSQTTTLSVLGAGMALRGPDGSMMTATDGLYEERSSVFKTFGFGLACTVGSVCISVWLILHWPYVLKPSTNLTFSFLSNSYTYIPFLSKTKLALIIATHIRVC